MPSGQMSQNPTNPLQGMPGVPSAQMDYLQRQMQDGLATAPEHGAAALSWPANAWYSTLLPL